MMPPTPFQVKTPERYWPEPKDGSKAVTCVDDLSAPATLLAAAFLVLEVGEGPTRRPSTSDSVSSVGRARAVRDTPLPCPRAPTVPAVFRRFVGRG